MRVPRGTARELRNRESAAIDGVRSREKALPPDSWDDILVSYWRGQEWARKARQA